MQFCLPAQWSACWTISLQVHTNRHDASRNFRDIRKFREVEFCLMTEDSHEKIKEKAIPKFRKEMTLTEIQVKLLHVPSSIV